MACRPDRLPPVIGSAGARVRNERAILVGMTALACFTFDNMGEAAEIGEGRADIETPHPSLTVGFPHVLDVLGAHDVRSTFFVEGWNGEHHADAVRETVARGHELGMHGWVHERWSELDANVERQLAERSTLALERAAGARPVGFRAPGGARTAHTESILRELGYAFDASLGSPGAPRVHPLVGGTPCVPFVWPGVDGYWYLRPEPADPTEVRDAWIASLEKAAARDGLFVLVCHAFITGVHDDRLAALSDVIDHACRDQRVRVCTAGEAAATI